MDEDLAACFASLEALTRLRNLLAAGRLLSMLDDEQREALYAVARHVARECIGPRRAAGIDRTARISPFASLRFVERVEIGARATLNPYACVWGGWSEAWARVGPGALISTGTVLVAGNHDIDPAGPVRDQRFEESDVSVGAGAWVAANAVVIGCRVGAEAVIGANAVVTQDIPDRAIAVGVPARVIGQRPPA